MYEAIFHLKQHTPMLHFLHDQPGATLRATELKPKLDKWIRREMRDQVPKEWIAVEDDKGHQALDYKIRIVPVGNPLKSLSLKEEEKEVWKELPNGRREKKMQWVTTPVFPQVLANVGGKDYKDELKNLVFNDTVTITISTWESELLERIKTSLPKLLANQNFGNRPSKGFGSFTCVKVDDTPVTEYPTLGYYFDWTIPRQNDFRSLFTAIDTFYKCIRSGINDARPDPDSDGQRTTTVFYFKSLMYAYATRENPAIDWDKKIIKTHFYESVDLAEEQRKDYRDWLGLSTDEKWSINGQLKNKFSLSKESITEGVERFPSPILIKPIQQADNQFKIYFGGVLAEEVGRQFKNAHIKISMTKDKKRLPVLELQPAEHFDVTTFLAFVYRYRNEDQLLNHLDLYDDDNINKVAHPLFRDIIAPIFKTMNLNPHAARNA